MLKDAELLCARLKLHSTRSAVDSDCIEKLHDVLSYLESVRSDLGSIDSNKMLHARLFSSLLKQAIKAAEAAIDICEAKIKSAVATVAVDSINSITSLEGAACPVLSHQRVHTSRERTGSSMYPRSNMHVNFEHVDSFHTHRTQESGGGDAGTAEQITNNERSPDGNIENVVVPAATEAERNSVGAHVSL